MINHILVARDGTVYAATTTGLAWSRNTGMTWHYLRGRDYAAKVRGFWGGAPRSWGSLPKSRMNSLLAEDYCTSLAESEDGNIWVGHWRRGCSVFSPKKKAVISHYMGTDNNKRSRDTQFVNVICIGRGKRVVLGTYGGGLLARGSARVTNGWGEPLRAQARGRSAPASLPEPARAPNIHQIKELRKKIRTSGRALGPGGVVYFDEDWTTG